MSWKHPNSKNDFLKNEATIYIINLSEKPYTYNYKICVSDYFVKNVGSWISKLFCLIFIKFPQNGNVANFPVKQVRLTWILDGWVVGFRNIGCHDIVSWFNIFWYLCVVTVSADVIINMICHFQSASWWSLFMNSCKKFWANRSSTKKTQRKWKLNLRRT